jgi:hypothetical protein
MRAPLYGDRFTKDNTEGYSDQELRALNVAFRSKIRKLDKQSRRDKSVSDHTAERVLAEFDVARYEMGDGEE